LAKNRGAELKKRGAEQSQTPPKEVLHKLQFFIELLHGGVCVAVPNTLLVLGYGLGLN